MQLVHRFLAGSLLLALATFFSPAVLEARPIPTSLATGTAPLIKKPIMNCHLLIEQGPLWLLPWSKLYNFVDMVKVTEFGYLVNAISFNAYRGEESTGSFQAKRVLPYLLQSPIMTDVLKLRRTARCIKHQQITADLGRDTRLTDAEKQSITQFLANQINSPLVIVDQSQLQFPYPAPGPCMDTNGIVVLDAERKQRLLESSIICVLDIKVLGKTYFSLKDALDNDTLDIVIGHEVGHAIMYDMYGRAYAAIRRQSTNGHDAPYITCPGLAYTEGWAEAFEALYGPANPKLKEKDRKKYNIAEFLFSRQDPVRRDSYVWEKPRKRTGILKNGLQIMCTEGAVAGMFYDLMTHRSINAPFEKCVTTMLRKQPLSFVDFVKGYVELNPEDREIVYRIILESSNYVTMSNEAAGQYKAYYDAHRAFIDKKISNAEANTAKQKFLAFKEDLFKKAMAGQSIFANVGPDLWFSGVQHVKSALPIYLLFKMLGADANKVDVNVDLNTITAPMLEMMGMPRDDAQALIETRQKQGFFPQGDPLKILEKELGSGKFAAFKAKAELKPYVAPKPKGNATETMALDSADLQQLAEANGIE